MLLIAVDPAQAATTYRVRWGDTLTWIAQDHHIALSRLAHVNGVDPYGVLVEGTVLRIPHPRHSSGAGRVREGQRAAAGGRHYTVRWGDTLTGIAARNGTPLLRLARINGLDPYGVLLAGAVLRLPGGRATSPAPSPQATHRPKHQHQHQHQHQQRSGTWSVRSSIDHWAAHYGVDPQLARAIAWMESGYHTGVVSSVGAWGVMQVMPGTWSYVEASLIGHPVQRTNDGNIRIGIAYIHHLLVEFGGDERLALAAYYQGPGAVEAFGVLPVSDLYIADVLALKSRV